MTRQISIDIQELVVVRATWGSGRDMAEVRAGSAYRLLLSAPSGGLSIALTTQITALSWLLQNQYHLAIDDIAIVWAAGPLAGIIGQLAVGHASDRSWWLGGRRRPYLLISGVLSAAALFAMPRLETLSDLLGGLSLVMTAALVALALDIAINVGLNPARALIADVVPSGEERSITFAYMQTLSGLLGVGTTIVGAWLGNLSMILVAAILTLPLTALPAFFVREPRSIEEGVGAGKLTFKLVMAMLLSIAPSAAFSVVVVTAKLAGMALPLVPLALGTAALTALLAVPIFRSTRRDQVALSQRILFAQGLSWIGIFSMFVFLAPVVSERLPMFGADRIGRSVAVALGLFNLVAAIAPLTILMPLIRRYRRAHVHAAAMAMMGLSFAAIGQWVHSEPMLWICMAIAGIGWGSLVSLPYVIFCDRVDARQLGLLLGVFNLAVVIPQLVVSLGLGGIAPMLGSRGDLFLIAATALIAAAFAWSRIPPVEQAQTPNEGAGK
jgi:maltose/moltooligosaccharide transporter